PERDTSRGWAAMTPPSPGLLGEYQSALAAAADTRQHELGQHALATQPGWATEHLGAPPGNEADRGEWVRRAGIIAAYRELAALPETATSLGAAPSREQPLHRALWQRAVTAAGMPADALDYTTASDHDLHQMRAAYHRQLAWAPAYVHDELRDSRICATAYHHDAILFRAHADLLPPASPDRARAGQDVAAAEQLAAYFRARV